jgi:hypothetical protein
MSLDTGDGPGKIFPGLDSLMSHSRSSQPREQSNGPKAPVAKLFEQGIYQLSLICCFLRWKCCLQSRNFQIGHSATSFGSTPNSVMLTFLSFFI